MHESTKADERVERVEHQISTTSAETKTVSKADKKETSGMREDQEDVREVTKEDAAKLAREKGADGRAFIPGEPGRGLYARPD